jgi:hypothetical protein
MTVSADMTHILPFKIQKDRTRPRRLGEPVHVEARFLMVESSGARLRGERSGGRDLDIGF